MRILHLLESFILIMIAFPDKNPGITDPSSANLTTLHKTHTKKLALQFPNVHATPPIKPHFMYGLQTEVTAIYWLPRVKASFFTQSRILS